MKSNIIIILCWRKIGATITFFAFLIKFARQIKTIEIDVLTITSELLEINSLFFLKGKLLSVNLLEILFVYSE